MREIGDVWHELFIKDEQAVGIEILIVLVRRFLRHGEHEIRHDDMRMKDGLVIDDDFGLRRTAAGFRAVGLGLYSQLVV